MANKKKMTTRERTTFLTDVSRLTACDWGVERIAQELGVKSKDVEDAQRSNMASARSTAF